MITITGSADSQLVESLLRKSGGILGWHRPDFLRKRYCHALHTAASLAEMAHRRHRRPRCPGRRRAVPVHPLLQRQRAGRAVAVPVRQYLRFQFRFRLGTNNSSPREGRYIDDIKVQGCGATVDDTIFTNGFDP